MRFSLLSCSSLSSHLPLITLSCIRATGGDQSLSGFIKGSNLYIIEFRIGNSRSISDSFRIDNSRIGSPIYCRFDFMQEGNPFSISCQKESRSAALPIVLHQSGINPSSVFNRFPARRKNFPLDFSTLYLELTSRLPASLTQLFRIHSAARRKKLHFLQVHGNLSISNRSISNFCKSTEISISNFSSDHVVRKSATSSNLSLAL